MRPAILLFTILGSAIALPQWGTWQSSPSQSNAKPQALYFMTNDVTSNQVVATTIDGEGNVSGGKYYATGGVGGNYVNSANGKPNFPDALSSQDAIVRAGNYLFVVNAGSNTVSMFSISPNNPTQLLLLGKPEASNGEFPTTLAASITLMQVCVGNTGVVSGVSCSAFTSEGLSGFDALRQMNVGEVVTPPTGPTPGYGDILFSEDNNMLLVMVKGNGTEFTGYAATFPVEEGKISRTATIATPPGSMALFGTGTIPGQPDAVFVSDAGLGALVLKVTDLGASPLATINVTGQSASCWAAVTASGRGFITDAGVNRLVEVNVQRGAIVREYYPPTSFEGMTDFRIVGDYLWTLSASNGSYATSITTFNISGSPGSIEFGSVYAVSGAGGNSQGLATY